MRITLKGKESIDQKDKVVHLILNRIHIESRFKLQIDHISSSSLKLRNVRLKEKKRYCGNHPNACDIEGGRMGTWLEGADWVEFNDRLNDILDELDINARVYSSVCEIRDGKKRRINYESYIFSQGYFGPNWQWEKKGQPEDYENWCGKIAPASEFPIGTPGQYERNI